MIDFNNTKIAFHLKTDSELERAYFLFKMISNQPLVKIGTLATNFALKTNLPVEGLIRSTVFDHFCGGISSKDCISKIDQMFKSKVYSILDYSVEGKQNESQFEFITNKTIDLIDFAVNNKSVPFSVFKPTAVGRFEIYRKVSQSEKLEDFELEEWNKIKKRFDRIFNHAKKNNIPVLVDAEESWIQTSVDNLLLDFMKKYNKTNPIIYNTLQAYRWDRYDYLVKLHEKAKNENFIIGIKLVRGAYMEKERAHANDKGYKSPICETKLQTDKNFDNCLTFMIDNLDYFHLYIGTHNEKSTLHALKLLSLKGISNDNSKIWFGQLFGMSDHISFNLANSKYNVSKYLPFGPVRDVMPYLIRRAEENTSVAGQTNRELELIKSEMKRRSI